MLQKMGLRRRSRRHDRPQNLAAEARSRGIAVSDEELSEFLIKNFGLEKITAQEWKLRQQRLSNGRLAVRRRCS